jgi:hypothetical protein
VSIAGGLVGGGIAFAIAFVVVSKALAPRLAPRSAWDDVQPSASAKPVAQESQPGRGGPAASLPGDLLAQHQRAVADLVGCYNEIADGYALIRDGASIARGQEALTRGAARLKTAAQHGRELPTLPAADRLVVAQTHAQALLGAIDRIIRELQRLKATPGLKSDFDRSIAAYSTIRQQIDREIHGQVNPPPGPAPEIIPLRPPNLARPGPQNMPPRGPRIVPPGPRGRMPGRR